jgi:diguanylate cyclase (GGDEF)-like protein
MISPDLQRAITDLADVVSQMDDLERACEFACDRLQDALQGPVAILERTGARWRLRSSTSSASAPESEFFDDAVAPGETALSELVARAAAVQWAWVPLGGGEDRVMLVPADWQRQHEATALEPMVRQLGFALEAVALRSQARERRRILRSSYAFGRRLSRVRGQEGLHQFISDQVARASRANLAALALFSESEGHLRVVATTGYPHVLVQHVRVNPGEGVIGTVFTTRRPLLVSDISKVPHLHRRRPRYRTPSFMAVPLLWEETPLGVVCVTDRMDRAPFESDDLRVVRALAASSSLALTADAISERAELLSEWATIDPLTELFNRRYFRQRLEEEYQRARRYELPLSLLLLDLDDFKTVNDRFGHPAGDLVLRSVADVLRRNVRAFDVCCRYGGEEFVIVLPGGDSGDALSTANRVRQAIEAHRISVRANQPPVGVTASIGSVTLKRGDSVDDMITEADAALYEAKRAGKNQIRVAAPRS